MLKLLEKYEKNLSFIIPATFISTGLFVWVARLAYMHESFVIGLLLPFLLGAVAYFITKWVNTIEC